MKLPSLFSFIKQLHKAITISLYDGLMMCNNLIGVTKENGRKGAIMEQRFWVLIKLTWY